MSDVAIAALASRACGLLLAVGSDLLIPDHEAQDALAADGEDAGCRSALLRTFTRWDSAHFLLVAQHGWSRHEWSHAFFPLYPLLLRAGGWALAPVARTLALCPQERFVLAGLLISNAAFVVAACALHALGRRVVGDPALARTAALLFCASPASVFFSSVYTESCFAAATFGGALLLARGRPWAATASLVVASATRANGVLGALLVCHHGVARALRQPRRSTRTAVRRVASRST